MKSLSHIFDNNARWAENTRSHDAEYFNRLVEGQRPEMLWIGCADSRVPAEIITGLEPGQLFVHRNIANVVAPGDPSAQAVLQFAVDGLRVKHIIVCGHESCGGVQTALKDLADIPSGPLGGWLSHVQSAARLHREVLAKAKSEEERERSLDGFNAIEQAANVCRSEAVQRAWDRGQPIHVHAWLYRISSGLIQHLGFCATGAGEALTEYQQAVERWATAAKA
ncbi:MAG: carbonic anhydrase [Verrucomicrobiales bacterium]